MKMIGLALATAVVCLIAPAHQKSFGDVTMPFRPGTVKEQHNVIPSENTPLSSIFKQLEAREDEGKEGALLWLLRRETATDLSYFHRESIRFGVDHVRKMEVGGILWRLVECRYLSRMAELSGGLEHRAVWNVAYLFDDLGRLRDWVDDYDVLFLDDLNADGRLELFAYIDSPKRAIMYSYDRGRARELLRVDGVPEGRNAIRVIAGKKGKPLRVAVAERGAFEWDARSERYTKANAPVAQSTDRSGEMKPMRKGFQQAPPKAANELRCSISLSPTELRVGDPVVVDVKIESVLNRPMYVYVPSIYQAKLLEIRDEKGEIVQHFMTALYKGPPVKESFHLLKPAEDFSTQIRGRVAFDFVPASAPPERKAHRDILVKFRDTAHRVGRPGKFTANLRLSGDAGTADLGKRHGISPVWLGSVSSNVVSFSVRLMTREELDAVIGTLKTGNTEEKAEAIEVLKANADPQAVPALLAMIAEGPGPLTRPALDAVAAIQDTSIIPNLMALYRKTSHGEFQRTLLSTIRSLNPDARESARLLVETLGSAASVEARCYAAYELGLLRQTEGIPAMLRAAKAPSPRIQRAAIDGLAACMETWGKALSSEARSAIVAELVQIMKSDGDRTVRSRVASALGRGGDPAAVPALIEALKDKNHWVGSYAAHALGRLGRPEAIPALEEFARVAEQESQAEAAKRAIAVIQGRAE